MTYEQLKACYQTVLKQRDEAECKAVSLTILIDGIYKHLPDDIKAHVKLELVKIGV